MARTPFFGRGPGPQIARMDMQSATAPGRAYGKMFESLGESAGQAIETFSKNKQRGEALDGQIGAILMNMSPEQQAQVDTSPIGKTLKKFLNQDLSLSGKESLLGGLLVDQKMDAQKREEDRVGRLEAFEQEKYQNLLDRQTGQDERQARLDAIGLDKFLIAQEDRDTQIDFTREMFVPRERAYTSADIGAGEGFEYRTDDIFEPPPRKQTGDAPIVESLPEGWQRAYGREVAKRVNEGELDPRLAFQNLQQMDQAARANLIDPIKLAKFQQETTAFNQSQAFKTFTPEDNALIIDGIALPLSGTIGSDKVAEELKGTFIPNFNFMDQLFSRLMEIGEEESWWDDSTLKTEANGLVRAIQGQMREDILGPGTVTDPERAILDDIVANPFKKGDNLSAEEAMKLLQRLRSQVTGKFKNKLTNYGLAIGGGGGAGSTLGNGVEVIDLDRL